jgi:transcription elongation factor GreB
MDPRYVSMDAPLARALLSKRLDDEVTVETPAGDRTFEVTAIEY